MPERLLAICDICEQPLGPGATEGVCRPCLLAGAAWAHRHIVRLWARGCGASEIGRELGYSTESVGTIVRRLRRHGYALESRRVAR